MRSSTTLLLALASLLPPAAAAATAAPAQEDCPSDEELAAAERAEADALRRRGRLNEARRLLDRLLEDDEGDAATWAVLARCRLDAADYDRAERDATRALELAREAGDAETRGAAARVLAAVLLERGRYAEARAALDPAEGEAPILAPADDPRDAWILTLVLDGLGQREEAAAAARQGAATDPAADDWRALLAKGRCQRFAGFLEAASRTYVAADDAAKEGRGVEPDVLVALADLYFESEREVEAPGKRSAGSLYKEALRLHPTHEDGLLGLFELHRYNRRRQSRSPEEILSQLLATKPDSIRGVLAGARADLDDGKLVDVRRRLARLRELAPGRRDVRTLEAALAWVEHRRDDNRELLEDLLRDAPGDSAPEREVGRHLIELYRFAEAVPFLERSVERDPSDYEAWTRLGEALANTGDEDRAREALATAKEVARGRRDAFRDNLSLVLERMDRLHVVEDLGELRFSWRPDAAEVLRSYLEPYYRGAREELAARYGFTPGPTTIEVFREHRDFSVRSVGFEGFPALGVCFGPVVTALSPLSEMRGQFSWARTGFHEFSHVVHLGLSNNRCPRWITEGLATWEEVRRNPAWTRNMRRDLVDAWANDDLIPVRELNRAFRGPRILFGYYQGGLLCEMLIDRHGFPPMVRLLQAFDLGADLDQAFRSVLDTTPEEVDAAFHAFVTERVEDLAVEPRWSPRHVRRLQLRLGMEPPNDAEDRAEWADGWTTVAWGAWQAGRQLDAEEALRRLELAGEQPLRARFLRGEIALANRRPERARRIWTAAVEDGGRDYRALVGLGSLHLGLLPERDEEAAERFLSMATEVFPGYPERQLSAELKLVELYESRGDHDAAMLMRERWLAWNAGVYDMRVDVATWHVENGRDAEAVRLLAEANEVDPFRRDLHVAWGEALQRLGRFEEALREYRVALLVPAVLDPDHLVYIGSMDGLPPGTDPRDLPPALLAQLPADQVEPDLLDDRERAELVARRAECFAALGRDDEAADAARRALELDPGNERAEAVLE